MSILHLCMHSRRFEEKSNSYIKYCLATLNHMSRVSLLPSLWIILSFSCVLLSYFPKPILADNHNDNDYSNGIIDIHNGDLTQLQGHRDYNTVLIFTSSNPAHDCKPCQQVIPMVEQVATKYLSSYVESGLLSIKFYNIDLIDLSNADIFRELKMEDVPHLWLVAPSVDESVINDDDSVEHIFNSPHMEYSLKKATFERQVIEFAKFLSDVLMIDLPIDDVASETNVSPQSGLSTFAKTFIITFTVVALIKRKGPSFLTTTSRKTIMCYFAITIVLLCVGGSQFSLQRQSPFITKDEATGALVFISGGSMHYQYAIEIFIVAVNYASLSAAVIGLIKLGNYQVTESSMIKDDKLKFWLIILDALVVYCLYSCLTSIILKKDPGYPLSIDQVVLI